MSEDTYYPSEEIQPLQSIALFFSFKDEDKYVMFYVIRKYEKWMFLQIVCTVFPVVGSVYVYSLNVFCSLGSLHIMAD